jgi:hypothetical protein
MRFFNPAFLSNIEFSISDMLDMTIIIWDLWLKLLITVLDIYGQCVFYWYNPNPPVVPCQFWWCSLLQLAARSRCEMLCSRQRICFRWTWDGVGGEDRRVLTVAFAADRLQSLRFGFGSYRIWFYNNNNFFFYFMKCDGIWSTRCSSKVYLIASLSDMFTSVSDLEGRICNRWSWVRMMWMQVLCELGVEVPAAGGILK